MSEIRADQKDTVSKFMTAIWRDVIKPYYNPEGTDDWWGRLLDATNKVAEDYHAESDRRLMCILAGFVRGLEETAGTTRGRD